MTRSGHPERGAICAAAAPCLQSPIGCYGNALFHRRWGMVDSAGTRRHLHRAGLSDPAAAYGAIQCAVCSLFMASVRRTRRSTHSSVTLNYERRSTYGLE